MLYEHYLKVGHKDGLANMLKKYPEFAKKPKADKEPKE